MLLILQSFWSLFIHCWTRSPLSILSWLYLFKHECKCCIFIPSGVASPTTPYFSYIMVTWSSCPQSSKNIISSYLKPVDSCIFSKCLYLASPPFLPICSTESIFAKGIPGNTSRFFKHVYELIGIGEEDATPICIPLISGVERMYLSASNAPGNIDTVCPSLLRIPYTYSLDW